jgi:hypothetical protein
MPTHSVSCDLKARIPVLFYDQGFTMDQICSIVGVKKSLVYKTLQYFCDVTSRQGRSPDLGYVDFRMTKH